MWRDPGTGYLRRQIAPVPGSDLPFDVVQVDLPAGAAVSYPAAAFVFIRQLVFVLDGELAFTDGDVTHTLLRGDSIELGAPADRTFHNASKQTCSYLVVVTRP